MTNPTPPDLKTLINDAVDKELATMTFLEQKGLQSDPVLSVRLGAAIGYKLALDQLHESS